MIQSDERERGDCRRELRIMRISDKRMHTVTIRKDIDSPHDQVWAVLDQFDNLDEYSPKNTSCELLEGPDTGVGARRRTTVDEGFTVVHEIIEYEPGERYTFEFTETGKFPVRYIQMEFAVEPTEADQSRVIVTVEYTPKWGPLGWVLGKTLLKRRLRDALGKTLDGLAAHVESGDQVDRDASADEAVAS
jgi:uncharacterized protein YndB with AHSA1/START domain